MIKRILLTLTLFSSASAFAAGPAVPVDKAPIDPHDTASLQRGAQVFVNNCMGCHSADYMRYKRIGKDLALTDEQLLDNLIFTSDTPVGSQMNIAMRPSDAANWFGIEPPDLTLVARVRGADWLYTFLRGFYQDDNKLWGVNNTVFPDVGMPHVLLSLQGVQAPVYNDGEIDLTLVKPGILTPDEYDVLTADLVNFLAYMGEPTKLERQRLGVWVILFLLALLIFVYLLKREYWKDVH